MGLLKGKVAIITGGNSGIGKATAKLFVENGAQVVITARRQDALNAALKDIGGNAIGICGDVSDLSHHKRVADEISDRFGAFDIYFANAGVIDLKASEAVTEDIYDRHFNINTKGVFFGVQTLSPLINDDGTIIVTSSLAATKVLPDHTVYAGSKAAAVAFVKNWALEFKHRRIRANVISPGPSDVEREPFLKLMAETIPAGRLGTTDELARAALFLASQASSFINGIDLHVDGGMSLV